MIKNIKDPFFRKIVRAMTMATPFCIVARYGDFKHCVETSVVGAAVLRRYKIEARPIVCALSALSKVGNAVVSTGLSPRHCYERIGWGEEKPMPFKEWKENFCRDFPESNNPHEIIEAKFNGERVLIDLTIAQLREINHPDADTRRLPAWLVSVGDGWWEFDNNVWQIRYEASPHDTVTLEEWSALVDQYSNPGFEDDLHDMMKLAMSLDLDVDRFLGELYLQFPEETQKTVRAIAGK